jgi:hypothetical protein
MSNLSLARQVKSAIQAQFGNEPWFAGAGATREDGIGFVVKVSVRAGVARPAGVPPESIEGIVIQVIEVDRPTSG